MIGLSQRQQRRFVPPGVTMLLDVSVRVFRRSLTEAFGNVWDHFALASGAGVSAIGQSSTCRIGVASERSIHQ